MTPRGSARRHGLPSPRTVAAARRSGPTPGPGAAKDRLGRAGEDAAATYLASRGYRILGRNLRTPLGEVDILAQDGDTLVAVEVKTRRDTGAGHPLESIDARRRDRLARAVTYLLGSDTVHGRDVRFDSVAILWPDPSRAPTIDHVAGAFDAEPHP